jgi:hypothetical protein
LLAQFCEADFWADAGDGFAPCGNGTGGLSGKGGNGAGLACTGQGMALTPVGSAGIPFAFCVAQIPPPSAPKPKLPECSELLARWIDSYLSSYRGWTGGSPLFGGLTTWGTPGQSAGQYLVELGQSTGVDPAFILGIARAESSLGTAPAVNGGVYNIYGNSLHFYGASGGTYRNYFDPTRDTFNLIRAAYLGLATSEAAYGKYEGYEPGWKTKLGYLVETQVRLTGNPANIGYSCDETRRTRLGVMLGLVP